MIDFQNNIGAWIVLLITVAVSLLTLFANPAILNKCVLRPYEVWRGRHFDTLYLSGFVHGSMGHLLVNMFSFYFFAFALEKHIGTSAFVIGYLIAIIFSSLPSLYLHRNDMNYATLGASGGVSAVIFAHVIFYPTHTIYMMPLPIPIPAWLYAIGYLAYSFYAGRRSGGRINHDAHFAGALFGVLWILAIEPSAFSTLAAKLFN
ncbi:MAG: hypothetical protein JWM78_3563 [Verrucomicrobiaceae bacterium]|nr:hypothetical protein [Verrucomicrobiaceae bacterium]